MNVVWLGVCLCVHVHACGWVCVLRLEDNLWCHSRGVIHLFIEFSLAWNLPSWSGWLARKPQGIRLSLSPQCRNYKHMPPRRLLKCGFWRLNTGPYAFKVAFYRLTYLLSLVLEANIFKCTLECTKGRIFFGVCTSKTVGLWGMLFKRLCQVLSHVI